MIYVVNIRVAPSNAVYIGRKMPRHEGSPLGNPYKPVDVNSEASRLECLAQYKRWLWGKLKTQNLASDELMRLVGIAQQRDLHLACWCAPLSCHGDVVKAAVEWLMQSAGQRSFWLCCGIGSTILPKSFDRPGIADNGLTLPASCFACKSMGCPAAWLAHIPLAASSRLACPHADRMQAKTPCHLNTSKALRPFLSARLCIGQMQPSYPLSASRVDQQYRCQRRQARSTKK